MKDVDAVVTTTIRVNSVDARVCGKSCPYLHDTERSDWGPQGLWKQCGLYGGEMASSRPLRVRHCLKQETK